jgi:hypothetical protein
MAFIQIVEFRTSRFDELQELGREYESHIGGDNRVRRALLCRDRNDPARHLNIVFFDSHDEAMANSEEAVTQDFAAKMAALVDGDPIFHDLDVVEDRS